MESLIDQFWANSSFWHTLINDLPNCLKHTTHRMFADDTSLTTYGNSIQDLIKIWKKKLECGYKQISSALMLRRQSLCSSVHVRLPKLPLEPMMYVLEVIRSRVRDTKILGVYIDESLTWIKHIKEIAKRVQQELFL